MFQSYPLPHRYEAQALPLRVGVLIQHINLQVATLVVIEK